MAGGELPQQRRRVVDFLRLLEATERSLKEQQKRASSTTTTATATSAGGGGGGGLGDRRYELELNRISVFLRSLREQLTELHSFDLGVVANPKTLQGYSFRVDALERLLLARQQELRRFKASGVAAAATATAATATSTTPRGEGAKSPRMAAAPASRPLPARRGQGGGASGYSSSSGGADGEGMDKESQEKVNREKEAQQVLTAQLEELVGALKTSSMLVHSSLREQNKVLDKTEDAAQRNLEGLQQELRKTEEQLKRSWSNSLTSCMMIFLMVIIFAATFAFMKLFPKRRWMLW